MYNIYTKYLYAYIVYFSFKINKKWNQIKYCSHSHTENVDEKLI